MVLHQQYYRVAVACSLLVLSAAPACAQEGGDTQAQILYAYEAADVARLRSLRAALIASIDANDTSAAIRYHLAHADYRLGQLLSRSHSGQAETALRECASQLDELLDKTSDSAEALTLQAACNLQIAPLKTLTGALARKQADRELAKATRLEPRNPRVLWVRALQALNEMKRSDPIPDALKRAAEGFDGASATALDAPGWGHTDAYLAYGHELRMRGDVLGARNWIEKALLAAPDSKRARAELAALGH